MEKKYLIISFISNVLFWILILFVPLWGFIGERYHIIDIAFLGAPILIWFQFVIFIGAPTVWGLIHILHSQKKLFLIISLLLDLITIWLFVTLLFAQGYYG